MSNMPIRPGAWLAATARQICAMVWCSSRGWVWLPVRSADAQALGLVVQQGHRRGVDGDAVDLPGRIRGDDALTDIAQDELGGAQVRVAETATPACDDLEDVALVERVEGVGVDALGLTAGPRQAEGLDDAGAATEQAHWRGLRHETAAVGGAGD